MCMKLIHMKSSCCGARIHRHGHARRRCSACGRTWRVRQKRRGRKSVRVHPNLGTIVLIRGESVRKKAIRTNRGRETVRRRHTENLKALMHTLPEPHAPTGKLVAIADATSTTVTGVRYTIYLILLRRTTGVRAIAMEPYITAGHECMEGWRTAFAQIPSEPSRRICALVSDGFTGMDNYAREQNWVYQRCHFHLLKMLQSLRGKRWRYVKQRDMREEMYQLVCAMLTTPQEEVAETLLATLQERLADPTCPRWFALRTRGFVRKLPAFRAYLHHPELHLPRTTNVAESAMSRLAETLRTTRGFTSATALRLWITVRVRSFSPFTCRGDFPPN